MRGRLLQNAILLACFLGFFGAAVAIQHRGLENVRKNPPFVETWLLSGRSGQMLSVMSLRYDLVTADFLWLRAIQSFGGRGMTNRDWKPVYNMFDTITELDPYFQEAYTFGNMVIGDEGGRQQEGLQLLEKGMFKLLRQYRIPFEGLYVANWQMRDMKKARWFSRMTLRRKDVPDWVPRVAGYIEIEAGEFYIGFSRFVGNLMQALDAKDALLEGMALQKASETLHKWNRRLMLQAVDEYTSRTGRLPASLQDIAAMPSLQDYEAPRISRLIGLAELYAQALGKPGISDEVLPGYTLPSPGELASLTISTTATKENRSMMKLEDLVFRGSLVRQSGIPQSPDGSPYMLNLSRLGFRFGESKDLIMSVKEAEADLKSLLAAARFVIEQREKELGRKPKDLREVFYADFKTTEPFGGTWTYNPATGEFKSSSRPNL